MATYSNPNTNSTIQTQQEDENFAYAMQIGNITVFSMAFYAAVELDLFDIIGNTGQLSAAEIVAQVPTRNPDAPVMLDRVLRLMAAFSVVKTAVRSTVDGGEERVYELTGVGKYFRRDEDGVSLGPLLSLVQDRVSIDSWYKLKDAILEGGIPFNKAHGMNAFEYPSMDPRFNSIFNKGMRNQTSILMKKILLSYHGFDHIDRLVDVGGGVGHTLSIIVSKYPHIRGINFDLPHVIRESISHAGVEHVGGDMFERVPKGDAIMMKWILHDWSDEHCMRVLKNCYASLPSIGKMIVIEAIVPEEPETTSAAKGIAQMDLSMMTMNPGGKERTYKEFLGLANAAGFSKINLSSCISNYFWVMEFLK